MRGTSHIVSWTGSVLAVFSLGIMAGFFGAYSGNVNLATREFDAATYAVVQSALNRNVRHALFFAFFFAPPLCCAMALAGGWRQRPGWWWLTGLVGLGYALGIVLFTRQVNLPLNGLVESWTPTAPPADWAAARDAWNRANAWRAGWSALLFALGLAALAWRAVTSARCRSAPATRSLPPAARSACR